MTIHEESRILIVDDVNAMRIQVSGLLRGFGFTNIKAVGNGEEAKAALLAGGFNLVLCDWHMQPTDGLELLKYVRGEPSLKNLAFIMVTGEGTKDRVTEAIQAGVDDYLIKPLTRAQIESKVYTTLLKKRGA